MNDGIASKYVVRRLVAAFGLRRLAVRMKNNPLFTLTQSGDKSPHSIRIYFGFPRPEKAARIMRTPLQGLILTLTFDGLRPSLNRMAPSGLFI